MHPIAFPYATHGSISRYTQGSGIRSPFDQSVFGTIRDEVSFSGRVSPVGKEQKGIKAFSH